MAVGLALLVSACTGGGSDPAPAAPAPAQPAPAPDAPPLPPYYEGKTITLLVPFNPGGGADTTARILQPFLEKFIPGNPTVIVENRGGGGSMPGTNYFANDVPKDGTYVLISSGSTHSAYALADPNVDFDFSNMTPVIGFPFGGVMFVSAATGIKEPGDILKAAPGTIIFAARNPSGGDLRRLLTLDALGVAYTPIFGYESASDTTLAFLRGEATLATDSVLPYLNTVVPEIEAGRVVPVMSTGFLSGTELVRVPALPDLLTPVEVYEQATGKKAEGPIWEALKLLVAAGDSLSKALWLHSEAPQQAIDEFQLALSLMFQDAEALAALDEEFAGNDPLFGDELSVALKIFTEPDPEVQRWLQDYLIEKWDYKAADFGR